MFCWTHFERSFFHGTTSHCIRSYSAIILPASIWRMCLQFCWFLIVLQFLAITAMIAQEPTSALPSLVKTLSSLFIDLFNSFTLEESYCLSDCQMRHNSAMMACNFRFIAQKSCWHNFGQFYALTSITYQIKDHTRKGRCRIRCLLSFPWRFYHVIKNVNDCMFFHNMFMKQTNDLNLVSFFKDFLENFSVKDA